MTIDGAGHLFGTTSSGGTKGGFGTVFELAPAKKGGGFVCTLPHAFTRGSLGSTDGGEPFDRAVFGPNGTLYGTTVAGGNANSGVVYNLFPASRYTKENILLTFTTERSFASIFFWRVFVFVESISDAEEVVVAAGPCREPPNDREAVERGSVPMDAPRTFSQPRSKPALIALVAIIDSPHQDEFVTR